MSENAWSHDKTTEKGIWMPTMLKKGDTVGVIEPNLYTGVGVAKEKDRGEILEILPDIHAALVEYPQGKLIIFLRDLLFYGRCPLCEGSRKFFKETKRTMGYTLTPGETIEEETVPCPLCSDNK